VAAFEAWLVLLLVVNVVELQQKRTLAASCGFLAAARLSCLTMLSCNSSGTVDNAEVNNEASSYIWHQGHILT